MRSKFALLLSSFTGRHESGVRHAVLVMTGLALAMPVGVAAQTIPTIPTPIAPSQVTPRSLRPAEPTLPMPLNLDEATPAEVPAGADTINVRVARIEVDGEFPELAATSRRLLGPLENKLVTVADLYRGAAALENAYSDAGYFLARVVIVQQRLADMDVFRIRVVDGFVEQIDTQGLPARVRRPVLQLLQPVVGKRHLTLAEMERRLTSAAAIPGMTIRSTLARGDSAGGARLVLEGRHQLAGLSIGGDNRLGPSFDDWGLNVQAQLNSALGYGEQFYLFLSGDPRIDRAFRGSAPRRVGGVGAILPLTASGLTFNPEFTVSDTHPISANPIFASDGRLYRSAFSLAHPLLYTPKGALLGRVTLEVVSETQSLPFFDLTLSKDRLSVVRGNLFYNGSAWGNASIAAETTISQGTSLFHARTPASIARSETASSRGSDPQFTKVDGRAVLQQAFGQQSTLTVIARAQTSFGTVLPSSELFDLGGLDGLSPLTAGALSTDGGAVVRGELAHRKAFDFATTRLQIEPYLFGAAGLPHAVIDDPFLPSRAFAYGVGIRFATTPLPFGAAPTLTLEFGQARANRGAGSNERLSVLYGVSF